MKWGLGWSSAPGGWPEGSAWADGAAPGPLHAHSAPGLSLMFPRGQDLGYGPDFITYQQMGEIILGRRLALRVQREEALYWLAGTSRHLAHGSVHACTHPRLRRLLSLARYVASGRTSGFSLEKFPVQVHGSASWPDCSLLPRSPPGGRASPPVGLARSRPSQGCPAIRQSPSIPASDANNSWCLPDLWAALDSRKNRELRSDGFLGAGQDNILKNQILEVVKGRITS